MPIQSASSSIRPVTALFCLLRSWCCHVSSFEFATKLPSQRSSHCDSYESAVELGLLWFIEVHSNADIIVLSHVTIFIPRLRCILWAVPSTSVPKPNRTKPMVFLVSKSMDSVCYVLPTYLIAWLSLRTRDVRPQVRDQVCWAAFLEVESVSCWRCLPWVPVTSVPCFQAATISIERLWADPSMRCLRINRCSRGSVENSIDSPMLLMILIWCWTIDYGSQSNACASIVCIYVV